MILKRRASNVSCVLTLLTGRSRRSSAPPPTPPADVHRRVSGTNTGATYQTPGETCVLQSPAQDAYVYRYAAHSRFRSSFPTIVAIFRK